MKVIDSAEQRQDDAEGDDDGQQARPGRTASAGSAGFVRGPARRAGPRLSAAAPCGCHRLDLPCPMMVEAAGGPDPGTRVRSSTAWESERRLLVTSPEASAHAARVASSSSGGSCDVADVGDVGDALVGEVEVDPGRDGRVGLQAVQRRVDEERAAQGVGAVRDGLGAGRDAAFTLVDGDDLDGIAGVRRRRRGRRSRWRSGTARRPG